MSKYLCEHTDRPYYAKGFCKQCYDKNRRSTPEYRRHENALLRAKWANDLEYQEHKKQLNARWRERNPEKVTEQRAKWRNENRERHIATSTRWNQEHPEKRKEISIRYQHKRRSILYGLDRHYTKQEWVHLTMLYDNLCGICAGVGPLTVDHIMPLSRGGSNMIDNIQPLCGPCNSKKWAYLPEEL